MYNVPMVLQFFIDRVVRQVNETAMGRVVKLGDQNGGGWKMKQALHANESLGRINKDVSLAHCE